jgi:aspartyl/glutamyl-tRNA(Asn/Gln) amidotransferase C subunit
LSRRAKAAVSLEQVRRLATLSKLTLTRSEEEQMKDDLSSILTYFKVVDGVAGVSSPSRLKTEAALLRADEVKASDPDGALRGVPRRKGRLVRAPRVF